MLHTTFAPYKNADEEFKHKEHFMLTFNKCFRIDHMFTVNVCEKENEVKRSKTKAKHNLSILTTRFFMCKNYLGMAMGRGKN